MSIVFDYDDIAKRRANPNLTEEDEVLEVAKIIYENFAINTYSIYGAHATKWEKIVSEHPKDLQYWIATAKFVMKHGFHK